MVSRDVFGGKFGVWFGDADKGNVLAMGKFPQQQGNVVVGEAGNRESKGRLDISVCLLVCARRRRDLMVGLGCGNRACINKTNCCYCCDSEQDYYGSCGHNFDSQILKVSNPASSA
jgi:hypothetical protein